LNVYASISFSATSPSAYRGHPPVSGAATMKQIEDEASIAVMFDKANRQ
jgi:hypothetical protein